VDRKAERDVREESSNNIDLGNEKDTYPNLYHMIGRITHDLLTKLEFAKRTVALRTRSNENMILCSLRHWHRLQSGYCNERELGRQNERIDRYALLGLIRMLPDVEINRSILDRANEVRDNLRKQMEAKYRHRNGNGSEKNQEPDVYRIQVYSIPEYTDELLSKAEETARKCRECGVKMNSISRDMILLVFGKKKAEEVYPLVDYGGLSLSGKDMMADVESEMLSAIEGKGYARESELVERLHRFDKWRSVTDRRVRKYIPGLMIKHGLMQVTANKELKTEFHIESKGYPKIIIRQHREAGSCSPSLPTNPARQIA